MQLAIEPLCAETFAPFGEVIEPDPARLSFSINEGTSQRFHDLARLDPGTRGRLIVSIFRAQPRRLPLTVTQLERHPDGSQAFMPLGAQPFLVVVAPPGERIDPTRIRCFLAHGQQGVNFSAGIWHHSLLALHSESDFLVIDRDHPDDNCETQRLDTPFFIHLELDASLLKRLTGALPC